MMMVICCRSGGLEQRVGLCAGAEQKCHLPFFHHSQAEESRTAERRRLVGDHLVSTGHDTQVHALFARIGSARHVPGSCAGAVQPHTQLGGRAAAIDQHEGVWSKAPSA